MLSGAAAASACACPASPTWRIRLILYTCANDRMIEYSRVTLVAARQNLPGAEIRIIPFDENIELTQALAARVGAKVIEPDPFWDMIGKHLYGDIEYRPGIPSFRYFRKLNIFNGQPERFLFFDANMAILSDLKELFQAYRPQRSSVVFSHYAQPRQFKVWAAPTLRMLNPSMRDGYGCSGIMGKGDAISKDDARIFLRNKNWKRLFAKAPEQAFMSALSCIIGAHWMVFSQLLGVSARNVVSAAPLRRIGDDGRFYYTEGGMQGKVSHFCKWTHQSLREDTKNIDLYRVLEARADDYLRDAPPQDDKAVRT